MPDEHSISAAARCFLPLAFGLPSPAEAFRYQRRHASAAGSPGSGSAPFVRIFVRQPPRLWKCPLIAFQLGLPPADASRERAQAPTSERPMIKHSPLTVS